MTKFYYAPLQVEFNFSLQLKNKNKIRCLLGLDFSKEKEYNVANGIMPTNRNLHGRIT